MTALARQSLPVDSQRALTRWLGGTSPHTTRAYRHDVREWLQWCADHGLEPGRAKPPDLTEYLSSLQLAEATKARRCSAVLNFYEWMREEGVTDADPTPAKAKRPRVKGMDAERLTGLDAEQARTLMAVADAHSPRAAALVSLLLTTGLRISEALSIDELTHRPGRTTVTVLGKGKKARTVVVPALAAERCEAINRTPGSIGNPMFATRNGRRMTPRDAWDMLRRLGVRAGIPHLHPHMLRHTAATLALTSGSNIQSVRAMLGHSSLGTTQRYVEAAGTLEHSPAYSLAAQIAPPQETL